MVKQKRKRKVPDDQLVAKEWDVLDLSNGDPTGEKRFTVEAIKDGVPGSFEVAHVVRWPDVYAPLFAAAPKLLEACEAAVKLINEMVAEQVPLEHIADVRSDIREAIEAAKQAI